MKTSTIQEKAGGRDRFRFVAFAPWAVVAPMAGGPTTPSLVIAAAEAGGAGLLAGGYITAEALAAQIGQVRAAGVAFGMNLFAPNPVPVDPGEYDR